MVGKNVVRLREEKGWRTVDLASRAGLSVATVAKIETSPDGYTLRSLAKVATALEVPLADLFGDAA